MFLNVSGPQWTTDGSNDLANGTSNDMNGKGGKKGNNNIIKQGPCRDSGGEWSCTGQRRDAYIYYI